MRMRMRARARVTARVTASATASAAPSNEGCSLVWLTGSGDLRCSDHPGLNAAMSLDNPVVAAFCLDDEWHLKGAQEPTVRRLHEALSDLQTHFGDRDDVRFVMLHGDAREEITALAKTLSADRSFTVESDVTYTTRGRQDATVAGLVAAGVECLRWHMALRPSAPWERATTGEVAGDQCAHWASVSANDIELPASYLTYKEVVAGVPVRSLSTAPAPAAAPGSSARGSRPLRRRAAAPTRRAASPSGRAGRAGCRS